MASSFVHMSRWNWVAAKSHLQLELPVATCEELVQLTRYLEQHRAACVFSHLAHSCAAAIVVRLQDSCQLVSIGDERQLAGGGLDGSEDTGHGIRPLLQRARR